MRSRIRTSASRAIAFLAATAAAVCLSQGPASAQSEDGPATRAKFQFVRQNEDWSRFRASVDAGLIDRLKHLRLDDDGDVWMSLGGRVDTRAESWDGFGFGATTPGNRDTFLLSRAIAHADLHVGTGVRFWIEAMTAQVLGRDALPGRRRSLDLDTAALYQAFADVRLVGGDADGDGALTLRVGRQTFLFGAQRLVSPLPWANTLRTWDGVSARYDAGPWSVTGFATWFVPVQKRSFNDSDDDQEFYGVYATRAPREGGRGYDLYVLGNTRPNVTINGTTGNERRHTVGGRTWGALGTFAGGKVDGEVEGAWQFGEVGNADVSAWSVSAVLGCRPDDWRWSPRFFCGVDAASGDDRPGGDVETFHQLFPLGHAYLGWADAVGRQNVFAVQVGAQMELTPSTSLQVIGHSFRLLRRSDALYNVGGGAARTGLGSRDVGHEVDLLVNHKVDRHVALYGGYSHLFAGDGIAASGPSEDQRFLYLGASLVF